MDGRYTSLVRGCHAADALACRLLSLTSLGCVMLRIRRLQVVQGLETLKSEEIGAVQRLWRYRRKAFLIAKLTLIVVLKTGLAAAASAAKRSGS